MWVNDLYEPLYCFLKTLQLQGDKLTRELQQIKQRHPDRSSARSLFEDAKEYLSKPKRDPFHTGVAFYVVNKCSFSGLTESSSFSPQASDSNFSMRGIEKLKCYKMVIKDWNITNLSYEQLLVDDTTAFILADPP